MSALRLHFFRAFAYTMNQKEIFLTTEGDAYLQRNRSKTEVRTFPGKDILANALVEILPAPFSSEASSLRVLEIGCSNATRLRWLRDQYGARCFGLDPSPQAVSEACGMGLDVRQGTADRLPFPLQAFDMVIFGTCLYLCDKEDLFSIAAEADRVLATPGWLVIADFFSQRSRTVDYRHAPGVLTHKMNYSSMFSWHPHYTLMTQKVRKMYEATYTDDADEWVGLWVLRKCPTINAM